MQAALRESMHSALRGAEPALLPDAGFALLRLLEAGAALAERVLEPPLPARTGWADLRRPAATPAPGDVLVAHPLMRRDVVLLLGYQSGCAFGLVTNAPTPAKLGGGPLAAAVDVLAARSPPRGPLGGQAQPEGAWTTGSRRLEDELSAQRRVRDRDLEVFADHHIFYGGPDGGASVTMLHPYAAVPGAVCVREGLYYGGDLAAAAALVRCQEADATSFFFYKGRVDWRPAELTGELAMGEWVLSTPGAAWPPIGLLPRTVFLSRPYLAHISPVSRRLPRARRPPRKGPSP